MIVSDFLRLNDWYMKRFIIFIISLLIAYDFSFMSDIPLYGVKPLAQILGFVILTFVPGYIILRIFKIHNIDRVVGFLLAIGLSLSFTMIYGFYVNLIFQDIGISKPISTLPLFYALNGAILILLIVCYFRDKEFISMQDQLCIKFSPMLLYLVLLPILSILGTYCMNYYNFNIPLMILLFLISLFPILVTLGKISRNLYPFMILSVSLSILYSINLISTHLWSYDIFFEAYNSNYILQNGVWNPSTESIMPLLLFTILSPIYSLLCELNIIWVFKIIFPFLFSFTPLILYKIYQEIDFGAYKLDSEAAVLSVFLFIYFYGFFKNMPDKEHIAELFLASIFMLGIINIRVQKIVILLIFSFSLIASHYAVSSIFMLSLILSIIINKFKNGIDNYLLTPNYILFFSVLAISWFTYISNGYVFENIVHVANYLLFNVFESLKPDNRSGVTYVFYESNSELWSIYKLMHIILQLLILVGVLNLLKSIHKKKVKSVEISVLSIAFYILVCVQIIKTYGMGFDRVFQITLILLSPLSLWGFIEITNIFNSIYTQIFSKKTVSNKTIDKFNFIFKQVMIPNNNKNIYKKTRIYFAVFLMTFFLFNSGFLFEAAGDSLPTYCINLNNSAGWPVYSESEIYGVNWLKHYENEHSVAVFNEWSDIKSRDALLVSECFYKGNLIPIQVNRINLDKAYIYLGKYSMDLVEENNKKIKLNDTKFYIDVLSHTSKIYDSGNSNSYYNEFGDTKVNSVNEVVNTKENNMVTGIDILIIELIPKYKTASLNKGESRF